MTKQSWLRPRKEPSLEELDDALREIDELLEAWDNRLSIDNLTVAKCCTEGELKLGLEFSLRVGTEAVRENYIAVLKRILGFERALARPAWTRRDARAAAGNAAGRISAQHARRSIFGRRGLHA
jgi:hypothetical protein